MHGSTSVENSRALSDCQGYSIASTAVQDDIPTRTPLRHSSDSSGIESYHTESDLEDNNSEIAHTLKNDQPVIAHDGSKNNEVLTPHEINQMKEKINKYLRSLSIQTESHGEKISVVHSNVKEKYQAGLTAINTACEEIARLGRKSFQELDGGGIGLNSAIEIISGAVDNIFKQKTLPHDCRKIQAMVAVKDDLQNYLSKLKLSNKSAEYAFEIVKIKTERDDWKLKYEQHTQLQTELEHAKSALEEQKTQASTAQAQFDAEKQQTASLQGQLKAKTLGIETKDHNIAQLNYQLGNKSRQLTEIQTELEHAKSALEEQKTQASTAQAQFDAEKQQTASLQEQLEAKTLDIGTKDHNIARLNDQLDNKSRQLTEIQTELEHAKSALEEQKRQAATAQKQLDAKKQHPTNGAGTQTDSTNTHHRPSYSLEYVDAETIFKEQLATALNTLNELGQYVGQRLDQMNTAINDQQHLADPNIKENFQKISHTYRSELQQEINRLRENAQLLQAHSVFQSASKIEQIVRESGNLKTYIEDIFPKLEATPSEAESNTTTLATLIAPLDKIKSANTVYEKTRPSLSTKQKTARILGLSLAFGAAALSIAGGIALCIATAGLATPVVAGILAPIISALGSAATGTGITVAATGGIGLAVGGVATGVTSPLKTKEQKQVKHLATTGVKAACAFQAAQQQNNHHSTPALASTLVL